MRPEQLFADLASLEHRLGDFSFGELSPKETERLKDSLVSVINQLEGQLVRIGPREGYGMSDRSRTGFPAKGKVAADRSPILADLYHSLRTPVQKIAAMAEGMEQHGDQKSRSELHALRAETRDVLEVLNELKEYIELNSEKDSFEKIDFKVSGIVRDAVFLCTALITQKEVRLTTAMAPEVPLDLVGDPSRLSQILLYLLGNCIKLVQKGPIHLQVEMLRDHGNTCVLQFVISYPQIRRPEFYSDTGCFPDLPAQRMDRLFGTGLGRNIIEQLIASLDGQFTTHNNEGAKGNITFSIPYEKGSAPGPDFQYGRDMLVQLPRSAASPLHHLGSIWKECSGEIDLVEELLELFTKNMLEFIGKFRVYLNRQDYEKLQSAAAYLKGGLELVKADGLLLLVEALILNCKTTRDVPELNVLFDRFIRTYAALENRIDLEKQLIWRKDKT